MTGSSFWIGLAVAVLALAAAWLFLVSESSVPIGNTRFEAQDPWTIGSIEDAFDYAGERAHAIQGTVALQIDPMTRTGMIKAVLQPDSSLVLWLGDASLESSVTLRMQFDGTIDVWADVMIHGDNEAGDSRLPMTHALYAGYGTFELLIDGTRQSTGWVGFWSIADALRQSDGAIRDQGLVFTPLLRDHSVFSDPTRKEITLLLYAAPDSDDVILHLVFPDARIVVG